MKKNPSIERQLLQASLWLLIAIAAVGYLIIYGFEVLCIELGGDEMRRVSAIRGAYCLFAAVLFGIRCALQHPIYDYEYARWLFALPWSKERPMPVRRFLLGWQEFFIVALLIGASYDCSEFSRWRYPLAMFVGHAMAISIIFAVVSMLRVYLLYVGTFVMVCVCWSSPPLCMLIVVMAYLLLAPQIGVATEQMFYGVTEPIGMFANEWRRFQSNERNLAVLPPPYPYNILFQKTPQWRPSIREALILSLSLGLFFGFGSDVYDPASESEGLVVAMVLVAAIAGIRWMMFSMELRSPLTLRARIKLRQFIIPEYDVVYIAPLTVLVIGLATTLIGSIFLDSVSTAGGVALAAALYLALRMEPHIDEWTLTGPHRRWALGKFEFSTKRI